MSVIARSAKRKLGFKATKVAVKHPRLLVTGAKIGWPVGKVASKGSKPLLRRRMRRAAPPVAAAVVIGAGAVYFLNPAHGEEHRQQVAQLVS
jgi:hypothetical protein